MRAPEQLIAALERAPGIIIPLIRQADPAVVKRRPSSGKWSIHEHACHLAEVHPLFFQRLDLMLSEDHPAIRSYDPGRDDPQDALLRIDLGSALVRFTHDRERLGERLRQLRPEDWTKTAQHEEYNSYSVFTMFRHLVLHDFLHAYRIEELVLCKDWPALLHHHWKATELCGRTSACGGRASREASPFLGKAERRCPHPR